MLVIFLDYLKNLPKASNFYSFITTHRNLSKTTQPLLRLNQLKMFLSVSFKPIRLTDFFVWEV